MSKSKSKVAFSTATAAAASSANLSCVQSDVIKSSDNINLAILERLQALEKQLTEQNQQRKAAAARRTKKTAAEDAKTGADAPSATPAEAKPSKRQLQSINTNQFCIFDREQIEEYVEGDATNLVWLSYIPDTVIPRPEGDTTPTFRNTHCPIIEMNREKFIQHIESLGKKNRIFTIPSKEYQIVTKFHCDSTVEGDVWEIRPCEANEENVH